jgi:urea transporter
MAGIELGIASLADVVEATRQFFLFNAMLDMLLVASVALLSSRRSAVYGLAGSER